MIHFQGDDVRKCVYKHDDAPPTHFITCLLYTYEMMITMYMIKEYKLYNDYYI